MAKINTPRGKLVRKFGRIFSVTLNMIDCSIGNLMVQANTLKLEEVKFLTTELNFKKSKKLSLCMDC